MSVERADMPEGWRFWLDWQEAVCPNNAVEIAALKTDRGRYLGYIRAVAGERAESNWNRQ